MGEISTLLEKWRRQYGSHHYDSAEVQKNKGVRPHPRLALTFDSEKHLPRAFDVLEKCFAWLSQDLDQRQNQDQAKMMPKECIFDKVQEQLYACDGGSLNFFERVH